MARVRGLNLNLANWGNVGGITLTGSMAGAYVSNAGDVNNDGIDDFLISSPSYCCGLGPVYLIYGSTHLANINLANLGSSGITITTYNPGQPISAAGDVNGDGNDDFLIGGYTYSSNTGIVYLIYGRSNMVNIDLANLGNAGIVITGAGANYVTGISVSGAADVNGDGKSDFLIGAYGYNAGTGIVYLIYGSSNLTNFNLASLGNRGITLTGARVGDYTGISVSSAGDVNGDNKADMLIGASYYSSNTGLVYLVYGGSNLTNINLGHLGNKGINITGAGIGYQTGSSIKGVGDVNGDGKDDLLIGAYGFSTNTGQVYLSDHHRSWNWLSNRFVGKRCRRCK